MLPGLNEGNQVLFEGLIKTLSNGQSKMVMEEERTTEEENMLFPQISKNDKNKINKDRKKILEEIGSSNFKEFKIGGINPFEDIDSPIPKERNIGPINEGNFKNIDPNLDPNDPGIDISGLLDMTRVNALMKK